MIKKVFRDKIYNLLDDDFMRDLEAQPSLMDRLCKLLNGCKLYSREVTKDNINSVVRHRVYITTK